MYTGCVQRVKGRGVVAAALCVCRRPFCSGLDPVQQNRLRRTSFVATQPRGRDLFSQSFESRVRLCALHELADLYAPVAREALVTPQVNDPLSSLGNAIELRKAADGDAVYARSLAAKREVDAAVRARHTWNVIVVGLVDLATMQEPVSFPSVYPALYGRWHAGNTTTSGTPSREKAVRDLSRRSLHSLTHAEAVCDNDAWYWAAEHQRRLQKDCDTTLLGSHFTTTTNVKQGEHEEMQHFYTVLCIEPRLDVSCYRREEAQVELITAYRNILYEAAELLADSSSSSSTTRCADLVRVPVLSYDKCGPSFAHDIAKLSQQALIKGFHRLSPAAKECLVSNRAFHVELYVPPAALERFTRAFQSEAWEVPQSVIDPGRTALYPGLAPPRSLLTYDGWVGKRAEIVAAVETRQDVSLLASGATQTGLDGAEVVPGDIYEALQPISTRAEFTRRLEAEAANAETQHLVKTETLPAALQPGLQGNNVAADEDDKPE